MTLTLVRRRKVLTCFSSPSVVTCRFAGSGAVTLDNKACAAALSGSQRQREAQVVLHVVVSGEDLGVVGQAGQLVDEGRVQVFSVAAVEQRVAREQRRPGGV